MYYHQIINIENYIKHISNFLINNSIFALLFNYHIIFFLSFYIHLHELLGKVIFFLLLYYVFFKIKLYFF